jgi:hypothetical protein
LATTTWPTSLEFGFDFIPLAVVVFGARFPTISICGSYFSVIYTLVVVFAVRILVTPVLLFRGWIDAL